MKAIFLLIGVALLWGGGQGVYTSIKNTEPKEYDVNNIKSGSLPDKEWIKLINSNIDITQAVYFQSVFDTNKAKELYVPLINPRIDSIIGFLTIKDEFTVNLFNTLNNTKDEEKLLEIYNEYEDYIVMERQEISGLIRFGIEKDRKENQQLYDSQNNIISGFFVIDKDVSPEYGLSYFIFVLGLILTFFSLRKILIKKQA